jgi:hypothetical protein
MKQERYGVTEAEARKQIEQWANKFHTPKGAIEKRHACELACRRALS